jgi:cardiolipin synthase
MRVILVPVVFWLLVTQQLKAAFLVFVLAGISDGIDGFLAKRFHWETELGAYLDPIADKLLIVCIFIALGVTDKLPSWIVIAVVSRDLLIVIAVVLSWLLGHPTPMRPIAVSKANTVAQIVLAAVVLADEAFDLKLKGPVFVLIWVTGGLTIASLIAYLRVWLRHMTLYESTGSKQ